MRAKTSSDEPAGNVTTMLTGRIGQSCGNATFGDNISATANAARYRKVLRGTFICTPLSLHIIMRNIIKGLVNIRGLVLVGNTLISSPDASASILFI
jgi:hypothetical protein